jgi:hypothetical protein
MRVRADCLIVCSFAVSFAAFLTETARAEDQNACGAIVDFQTAQAKPNRPDYWTIGFHVRTESSVSAGHFDYQITFVYPDGNSATQRRQAPAWNAADGQDFFIVDLVDGRGGSSVDSVRAEDSSVNCQPLN